MTYKIVKNSAGDVVAFGPNDENYDPTLKEGEVLTIESDEIAETIIKNHQEKLLAQEQQFIANKSALLERLGITEDEAKLLLG